MKVSRPKTEKWHNYEEGDTGSPIQRHGEHLNYFKKGFWKKYDRKKFLKNIFKLLEMRNFILLVLAITILSCKPRVNPNEWVVVTTTCWNEMTVKKAGDMIPRLLTACDRVVVLPGTELSAEFKTETKFGNRLAGTVEMTYQWRITDPKGFISSAKSIVSSPTTGDNKVDPELLESVENAVVDKMLINLIREYTPNINPSEIDELELEKKISSLSSESFKGRGVEFSNLSLNVNLSPQAEEALDVISALNFYRSNGEEELGRKIIEAKAGATNIRFNNYLNKEE